MKTLADKLTNYVVRTGGVPEQSYEVYQYGFQMGIEMFICFSVSLSIALYMHMLSEFIIFMAIFALLRTYAGGLHMESFWSCFVCSVAVQTATLLFSHWYQFELISAWTIIIGCGCAILWIAPVESINRKLENIERKHCKKVVLKIIIGIMIFSAVCTVARVEYFVSLIALTMLIVLCSQYLGVVKYNVEKRVVGRK